MSLSYKIINIILVAVIIAAALLAGFISFFHNQPPKDLSKVSDSQIVSLLNKNPDAKDYMKNYADFKIDKKEI